MYKLSKKDKRILHELERDSRQSISAIANKVGLSKEVVNYRIRRMEGQKLIKGYPAVIDTSRLGYSVYRVLLDLKDVEDEKAIIDELKKLDFVGWLVFIEGRWDIVLLLWAKDLLDFKKKYEKIISTCKGKIKDKIVSPVFNIHHLKHNLLYDTKDSSEIMFGTEDEMIETDDTDKEIFRMLSLNSRAPLIDMAKRCSSSPNVIKYRIRRLEDEKVIIGYTVNIDMSVLGYSHFKVMLDLESFESINRIMYYLKVQRNVIYITESFGLGDIEFEALFRTSRDLNDFIKAMKRELPGVIKSHDVILTYSEELIRYFPY